MTHTVSHLVRLRHYGDAYIARCNGKTASCNSDPMRAVKLAALKAKTGLRVPCINYWELENISLSRISDAAWLAEWEAE
jgi:hypothetical protein